MARKLVLALALSISLLAAREASAIVILDYEDLELGRRIEGPDDSDFSYDSGEMTNKVFKDEDFSTNHKYWYVHDVRPEFASDEEDDRYIKKFFTDFVPGGFTGEAGWRFSDTPGAGAFSIIVNPTGNLIWRTLSDWWEDGETVRVFFASTNPPRLDDYALKDDLGRINYAQSYAPTPEPGSMILLGSGLAALYGAARRRRNKKDSTTQL
jgi:hypothetical protein